MPLLTEQGLVFLHEFASFGEILVKFFGCLNQFGKKAFPFANLDRQKNFDSVLEAMLFSVDNSNVKLGA